MVWTFSKIYYRWDHAVGTWRTIHLIIAVNTVVLMVYTIYAYIISFYAYYIHKGEKSSSPKYTLTESFRGQQSRGTNFFIDSRWNVYIYNFRHGAKHLHVSLFIRKTWNFFFYFDITIVIILITFNMYFFYHWYLLFLQSETTQVRVIL